MMFKLPLLGFIFPLLLWPILHAHAQQSNVTCLPDYAWMSNNMTQTPCLVAAYLAKPCVATDWTVPPLTTKGPYNPPSGAGINACRCNAVLYNLLSACSACQGGLVGTWDEWIVNCPASLITVPGYPSTFPAGTVVPSWSLLDPTKSGGTFDINLSFTIYTQNIEDGQPGSPANTGAIVGGILGAVGGLALMGFLVWFLVSRRKYQQALQEAAGSTLAAPLVAIRVEPINKGGMGRYSRISMDLSEGDNDKHYGAPPAGGYPTSYGEGFIPPNTYPPPYTTPYDPPAAGYQNASTQNLGSYGYDPRHSSSQPFLPQQNQHRGGY